MRITLLTTALLGLMTTSAMAAEATPTPVSAGVERLGDILGNVGQSWFRHEWAGYKTRFVTPDGRIVDNGNGDISHSEGQGYGLLLAVAADDQAGFRAIWNWTRHNLMVRNDGLAAWKWAPGPGKATDLNNATDGDILIAWALARAGQRWDSAEFTDAARRLAQAIGAKAIAQTPMGPVLLPGLEGFVAPSQPDGPVVNLSYWVFPAFDDLKRLAPAYPWDAVRETGVKLITASRFGPLRLPSDWVALGSGHPQPAQGFKPVFGYNAIRIPLYLAQGNAAEAAAARVFAGLWNRTADVGPFVIDVKTGAADDPLGAAGYRLITAVADCAADNRPVPEGISGRRDTFYYPETLRLLSMIAIQERYSQCL